MTEINIIGKEYFTQKEAMYYVGIRSRVTFRKSVFYPCGFYCDGRLMYRKDDLKMILENSRLGISQGSHRPINESALRVLNKRKERRAQGNQPELKLSTKYPAQKEKITSDSKETDTYNPGTEYKKS